jgi:hypothetical protein
MPRAEVTFDLDAAWEAIRAAQREANDFDEIDAYSNRFLLTLIREAQLLALAVDGLLDERDKAIKRERIATTAYDQQQSSYRELEALYQAMTERAQVAEDRIRRAAEHLPGRPDVAEQILSEAV